MRKTSGDAPEGTLFLWLDRWDGTLHPCLFCGRRAGLDKVCAAGCRTTAQTNGRSGIVRCCRSGGEVMARVLPA